MPKKSAGGPRDAVLNVRVPSRLKFGLDLVARRYRESISDVLIRALSDSLTSEHGGLLTYVDGKEFPVDLLPLVWDENEIVRTIKLALIQPKLLTRTEELVWNKVQADDRYWASPTASKKVKARAVPTRELAALQLEVLEADWEQLVKVASA